MTIRFRKDIAQIKNLTLEMSARVEEAVRSAIIAMDHQDAGLAKSVVENDSYIDQLEDNIDELVITNLALQQPMAIDLRFLTSALEIVEQLERVGDHAVNIAEQVIKIIEETDVIVLSSPSLKDMANLSLKMLAESINAFVLADSATAHNVRKQDSEVDNLHDTVIQEETEAMLKNKDDIKSGIFRIILALNLERIADLATNISEDVIFLIEGKLVKHLTETKTVAEESEEAFLPGGCPAGTIAGQEGETIKKKTQPLECLERHAMQVHLCIEATVRGLEAYLHGETRMFQRSFEEVVELEHAADMIKRNVRAHLPKGLIMPIDKFELFLCVNEQDAIADTAEDLMEWLSYYQAKTSTDLHAEFMTMINKCLQITYELPEIIRQARTYFQTGDIRIRDTVKDAIIAVRKHEHETDILAHSLKGKILKNTTDMFYVYFLVRMVELIGKIADEAENAMDVMRSMIAK